MPSETSAPAKSPIGRYLYVSFRETARKNSIVCRIWPFSQFMPPWERLIPDIRKLWDAAASVMVCRYLADRVAEIRTRPPDLVVPAEPPVTKVEVN